MKLLHTADWHIGQQFHGYDRKLEHLHFFDWLKKTIKTQEIDVLLIAGDVFDSPNPSAESQRLYYSILKALSTENPQLQIVIIAGNHDSAGRLEAPSVLLEEMNIHVRGSVKKKDKGEIDYENLFIPLKKNNVTEAWCIAVPYLRQGDYPTAENYNAGVTSMYNSLYENLIKIKQKNQAIIFMGHLQATGSEVSEDDRSERTIIGGLEAISPNMFDHPDVVYTALGHLHKAQRVSKKENVRYAGSPLPMSFAEKFYKQGANLIEINENKLLSIDRLEYQPLISLVSIPKEAKPLAEVLEELSQLEEGEKTDTSPFLEVKVLITEPEPSMRHQIEEALSDKKARLVVATPFKQQVHTNKTNTISYERLKTLTPLEMAEDIFSKSYGTEMPEKLKSLIVEVMEEINR